MNWTVRRYMYLYLYTHPVVCSTCFLHYCHSVNCLLLYCTCQFMSVDQKKLTTRPGPHDLLNQSPDHLEELTIEMLDQLQSEQLSLNQYCCSIITSIAPLLPGYLNKRLVWTTTDEDKLAPSESVAACIAVSTDLMSATMELIETRRMVNCAPAPVTEVCYIHVHVHTKYHPDLLGHSHGDCPSLSTTCTCCTLFKSFPLPLYY